VGIQPIAGIEWRFLPLSETMWHLPWTSPVAGDGQDRAAVAARLAAGLVSLATGVNAVDILGRMRGTGQAARARQLAMYLLHTALSLSYAEVARVFARDRSTVAHACRQVEDLRDDRRHDRMLHELESVLSLLHPLLQHQEVARP
jgi:hypothetical protein